RPPAPANVCLPPPVGTNRLKGKTSTRWLRRHDRGKGGTSGHIGAEGKDRIRGGGFQGRSSEASGRVDRRAGQGRRGVQGGRREGCGGVQGGRREGCGGLQGGRREG